MIRKLTVHSHLFRIYRFIVVVEYRSTNQMIFIFYLFFLRRNASPTNDIDNSSESDNSDGSSSGDSSSDENQKNEITDWSLTSFVKPDVQPKPLAPIEPLPSIPVPEVKPEPDVKLSSITRAGGADSKKFLSPMCLNNEQIKQEPIGECFVCR